MNRRSVIEKISVERTKPLFECLFRYLVVSIRRKTHSHEPPDIGRNASEIELDMAEVGRSVLESKGLLVFLKERVAAHIYEDSPRA